jgi:hypothetical protein
MPLVMPLSASYSWYGSPAPRVGAAPHVIGGSPLIVPLPLVDPDGLPEELPDKPAPDDPDETTGSPDVEPEPKPDPCCVPVVDPLDAMAPDGASPTLPEEAPSAVCPVSPPSASSPFERPFAAQPVTTASIRIVARLVLILLRMRTQAL